MSARILVGDVRGRLAEIPDGSVQCSVTSPPYWGLRDYGTAEWVGGDLECEHTLPHRSDPEWATRSSTLVGSTTTQGHMQLRTYRDVCAKCGAAREDQQIGLEATPEEYVDTLVEVFREVRRTLADDGVLWLNLGDSYAGSWGAQGRGYDAVDRPTLSGNQIKAGPRKMAKSGSTAPGSGLKPKDLVGIPWMVAFALRADGWWLRQDVIWAKPNCMPESVQDRCTKSHEYLFMLTKSPRYYFDSDAISEPSVGGRRGSGSSFRRDASKRGIAGTPGSPMPTHRPDRDDTAYDGPTRNKRSVWSISPAQFPGAHFAVMPTELVEPCVLSSTRRGDTVLDPFTGAGTVGVVALRHGREFVGVELNPEYAALAESRIHHDAPLFNTTEVIA